MFKRTNRNRQLFVAGYDLHPSARRDLERSWSHGFRARIMPILLEREQPFADMYGETGRPCWSVARQLGLMLLQEWFDLTDRELIDRLKFDVRFQYALELAPDQAYLSRRALYLMRARLLKFDPDSRLLRELFDAIAAAAIDQLELDVGVQRVDSTQLCSNICTRGKLALFGQALRHLGSVLVKQHRDQLELLDTGLRSWLDSDDESWFGKRKPAACLEMLALWAVDTVECLAEHEQVVAEDAYQALAQVVSDYCQLHDPDPDPVPDGGGGGAPCDISHDNEPGLADSHEPSADDAGSAQAPAQPQRIGHVKVRRKGARGGYSIQSVHDPDAGYGHKGTGYQVQISETCGNQDQPEIITDFELQSAADNDWGKTSAILVRLVRLGLVPWRLLADAGYPTPEALVVAAKMGTELYAPVTRSAKHDGETLSADQIVGREAFEFDVEGNVLRCPAGHEPVRHAKVRMPGCQGPEEHAFFARETCGNCPLHGRCVARGKSTGDYWVRIEKRLVARDRAVAAQHSGSWWSDYSLRSGIEATMSELKRGHGLGRLRVRGRSSVLMRTTLKVTACNAKRWLRADSGAARGPLQPASARAVAASQSHPASASALTTPRQQQPLDSVALAASKRRQRRSARRPRHRSQTSSGSSRRAPAAA